MIILPLLEKAWDYVNICKWISRKIVKDWTWLESRSDRLDLAFSVQTIALQDCMIEHKDYYKDFIGLADGAEGIAI